MELTYERKTEYPSGDVFERIQGKKDQKATANFSESRMYSLDTHNDTRKL